MSDIHPGTTDLASASYLFQGFPDAVMGIQFGYYAPDAIPSERYLEGLLNSPDKTDFLISSLRFIGSCVYVASRHRPVLVIKKSERYRLAATLQDILHKTRARGDRRLLALALAVYVDKFVEPSRAKRELEDLRSQEGNSPKQELVFKNVSQVYKNLSFADSPTHFERLEILR